MIATVKPSKPRLTHEHHKQFLRILPVITRIAQYAFRNRGPESRDEATAEVIAAAYTMFIGLVQAGREALVYPSPLALYGIKQVKVGRKAATKLNVRDVSSEYCQLRKGVTVERLDHLDRDTESWHEVLVEDRHAGPAETAASRIDFADWLRLLSRRRRKIATTLAMGETTGEAAKLFRVSQGRISQLRRELRDSWRQFQGEGAGTNPTAAVTT
jgi:hypothetical protein